MELSYTFDTSDFVNIDSYLEIVQQSDAYCLHFFVCFFNDKNYVVINCETIFFKVQ